MLPESLTAECPCDQCRFTKRCAAGFAGDCAVNA